MSEIKPDIETFAKIKVIGVGGSGNSVVNRMINHKIRGVDFLAINTDVQALHASTAKSKLHIGKNITRGLGAGMNPDVGKKAAEESQNEIRDMLKGANMVFVTCGLGGGTGSGASPVVAEIARDLGALTIGVVTKPFSFEGAKRMEIAEDALGELTDKVDSMIAISNDKLLEVVDKQTSLLDAFSVSDSILHKGVSGIAELITVPGLINVDFNDVRKIIEDAGTSLMGIGEAHGENRAVMAAKAAIENSLLDLSIKGAQGVLFTITGSSDLTMHEVNEVAKTITESIDKNANIIFGAVIDEKLRDTIKITVVATGFDNSSFESGANNAFSDEEDGDDIALDNEDDIDVGVTIEDDEKDDVFIRDTDNQDDIDLNKKAEDNDEDDKLDIPAFIRKKMM